MQIYLSRHIAGGRSYLKRTRLPVAGILAFLLLFFAALGIMTAAYGGISSPLLQWLIVGLLFLLATAAAFGLHRIGSNAHNDAWVFYANGSEKLFAVNVKEFVSSGYSIRRPGVLFMIRFFKTLAQTGRMLEEILKHGLPEDVKTCSAQIVHVTRLQLASGRKYAVCLVNTPAGRKYTQRYDITAFPQELTVQFEQHSASNCWEKSSKTYAAHISLSAALLFLFLIVCIASHPAVSFLPEALYFPCLFLLEIPLIFLGIFILKRRRGE